jgi:hypothetical protein
VPARVSDNAFNNPEYQRVLEGLTGWQRRAWLDGDWDLAAGQFFTTFRRDVHVVCDPPSSPDTASTTLNSPHLHLPLNSQPSTLNFWDDSRAREWFAALDYGFAHYTVVLLGCTDGDGNLFVVDEHAERLWLPQRHAAAIKAMLARHLCHLPSAICHTSHSSHSSHLSHPHSLSRFVAGADVFSRQSDGTTIAAQYAREGITLRPANMDRVNGWAELLQRFGDAAAGIRPSLFIHRRCGRLVETLPSLQHDPNRPEDVLKVDADEDGVGGDDAADALRYLVATKPRTVSQQKLRGL